MGWLIDLAKTAMPEPTPQGGADREPSAAAPLPPLPPAAEARRQTALAMADEAGDLREAFEERAGILEHAASTPAPSPRTAAGTWTPSRPSPPLLAGRRSSP